MNQLSRNDGNTVSPGSFISSDDCANVSIDAIVKL